MSNADSERFIIKSLLENDFYKFTMGHLIFKKYPNVWVKYALKNRTDSIRLADAINEKDLLRELDHARKLSFGNSELHYLRGTNEYGERMFCEDYLIFLKNLQLPEYDLKVTNGQFKLEFEGEWAKTIYWEIIALAIINELYFKVMMTNFSPFERDLVYARGKIKLAEKIKIIRQCAREGLFITFCDFGLRRRFGSYWQYYVVKTLKEEIPEHFLGTSNTYLANKHDLLPMGTSAHEMYMVMSGIAGRDYSKIRKSHNKVLQDWWEEYGWGLSIALTDTYGTDFFFRDMTADQARNWKGLRHDSGDPIEFGEKAIAFYKSRNIDSRDKLLVFSDGLEIEKIVEIARYFKNRIRVTFGWGTNLTNDMGFKTLSLVIKAVEANGYGLVKLSDNIAKAIGRQGDIDNFKKIFEYGKSFYEECKY